MGKIRPVHELVDDLLMAFAMDQISKNPSQDVINCPMVDTLMPANCYEKCMLSNCPYYQRMQGMEFEKKYDLG